MAGSAGRSSRRRRAGVGMWSAGARVFAAALLVAGGCTNGDDRTETRTDLCGRGGEPGGGDDVQLVRGVVGSEKLAFFRNDRVEARFEDLGLSVDVRGAGSRQIATSVNLDEYDFAFPSSGPAAERLQRRVNARESDVSRPFASPMVIASFESIAEILATVDDPVTPHDDRVTREHDDGTWTFDVAAFMALAAQDRRWDELNQDQYPVHKDILVTTTDPRDSNAGGMYLGMVSHVANGDRVVRSPEQEQAVLPEVTDLFLEVGQLLPTSDPAFDNYLSQGIGNTPLLFTYESQVLEQVVGDDGRIVLDTEDPNRDMVMMYPSPTVLSDHTLVPLNDRGTEVGRLLAEDGELQRLAALHGFRTADPERFRQVAEECIGERMPVRAEVVDVVPLPAFETLERLIGAIDRAYRGESAPPSDHPGGG
jgi:hypothetical protein